MNELAIEVMKRYERKYLIDGSTYFKLQDRISQFVDLDEYTKQLNFYTVSNLYYDTDDNNLIRTSIAQPNYKEKLRLRAYGAPTESDKVYLEIKKKYNNVINKRRTSFKLSEAYEFVETGDIEPKEYMNAQILKELKYFINLYKPLPKLYLAYDRRAYFGENRLRITFDSNIRARRYDLDIAKGNYGTPILDDDLWVLEIKVMGVIPLWLTQLLSEYKVYRKTFSKYGTEYKRFIKSKGNEEECLNPSLMSHRMSLASHGKAPLPQLV